MDPLPFYISYRDTWDLPNRRIPAVKVLMSSFVYKTFWFKDESRYRIDGEILKNELQKRKQHRRKPGVPAISFF